MNKQRRSGTVGSQTAAFAGSETCAKCHKDIYDTHVKTAHYLTSRPVEERYIKGSFEPGKNTFIYNSSVQVTMQKADSFFYQQEFINGEKRRSKRFDMVIGSGTKGQSYATWVGNKLFQLPITYFTAANQWSNSPGYPDEVVYNRPITSRCLECHSTYVECISTADTKQEEFSHNRIVYGVDCEKCHGSAQKHVQYQEANPGAKTAKFIINPSSFSRQQSLDMCSLCHGGRLNKSKPSFTFKPGDKLADYFALDTATRDANNIDVHGNQFGLLAASKCFKKSDMTCVTCHNTHENESKNVSLFSQRCMTCHNSEHGPTCKMTSQLGNIIKENCIDCHMPNQPSKAIAVLLQGSKTPTSATMRSHYIRVYPQETEKVVALFKQAANNK